MGARIVAAPLDCQHFALAKFLVKHRHPGANAVRVGSGLGAARRCPGARQTGHPRHFRHQGAAAPGRLQAGRPTGQPHPGTRFGAEPLQALRRQLVQKAAARVVAGLAVQHARLGVAQVQALARARNGHVHQPPLLLQRLRAAAGVVVREQAFFEPGDEHGVEFQPLGGVYGHELHRVLPALGLVVARFQRGVAQEGLQRAQGFAAGRLVGWAAAACIGLGLGLGLGRSRFVQRQRHGVSAKAF